MIITHDQFLEKECEVLKKFKEIEQSGIIVKDASELLIYYNNMYDNIISQYNKANVLVTGITGAGKSSLINAIFGKDLAKTGAGTAITKYFKKYSSNKYMINIYDSKGLEHGCSYDFIRTTRQFLNNHKMNNDKNSDDVIHIIWYVVNSATARWEEFEKKICKDLFNDIPIMFILNKTDISTKKQRYKLKKCIESMNLKNFSGIYEVVSVDYNLKYPDFCSKCRSDDIIIQIKHKTLICVNCKNKEKIKMENGRKKLVVDTCYFLPLSIKYAFTSAQIVSINLKEKESLNIIKSYWNKWETNFTVSKFIKTIGSMLAELSIVWSLKHSDHYGKFIAKNLVSDFKKKDNINIVFHTDTKRQKIHCTSLGIIWNRCLRYLTKKLFDKWANNNICNNEICQECVKEALDNLKSKKLFEIEKTLFCSTIEQYIEKEYSNYQII